VYNGDDGNNDEKGGEENNGGSHAMDTDPKRKEIKDASNNNLNGGSNGNNEGDGMQEQIECLDALQIGSLNLKVTPAGTPFTDPNLNSSDVSFSSMCNDQILLNIHKNCTGFHSDLVQGGSAWGLSPCRFLGGVVQTFSGRGSSATAGAGRDGWLRAEERRADVSSQVTAAVQADGGRDSSGQRGQTSRSEPVFATWSL
jgi:hypothetical protein